VLLLERMLGKSKPWEADYVKLLQAIKLVCRRTSRSSLRSVSLVRTAT
jgi:hypothetical protein